MTSTTGEIFWGEAGCATSTPSTSSFTQGTHLIPADFIAFVNPARMAKQDDARRCSHNFLAQTKALAFSQTADEVRRGTPSGWCLRCFSAAKIPHVHVWRQAQRACGGRAHYSAGIVFVEGTVARLNRPDPVE